MYAIRSYYGFDGHELVMNMSPAFGLNQEVEWREFNLRASITGVKNRTQWIPDLDAAWQQTAANYPMFSGDAERAINLLDTEDAMLWIYSLGATYDDGAWVIQSEALRLHSETSYNFV